MSTFTIADLHVVKLRKYASHRYHEDFVGIIHVSRDRVTFDTDDPLLQSHLAELFARGVMVGDFKSESSDGFSYNYEVQLSPGDEGYARALSGNLPPGYMIPREEQDSMRL